MTTFANLQDLFRASGPLRRHMSGFVPRAGQQRMAERVALALESRSLLLIEAGTGTGKTFAYLAPALLSGRRVLISTGTRTLQDQLYARDLPLLGAALGRPARVALLKGRANYLCRSRLAELDGQAVFELGGGGGGGGGVRRDGATRIGAVRDWALSTQSGDLAELSAIDESDPLRSRLVSTRESCTGSRCAEFARCHVMAARRAALEADVVVVNHHLLLADLALKEDGFGELLPKVDGFILDEAHQLPDLASEFFGARCGSRQFELLTQDARLAARELSATDAAQAAASLHELERELRALNQSLGRAARVYDWSELDADALHCVAALASTCERCAGEWGRHESSVAMRQCAERVAELSRVLQQFIAVTANEGARTVTVTPRGYSLSLLPYDIAPRFRALIDEQSAAWIFTSATLALNGDFGHFAARLGVADADTVAIPSPFDFERQALLYLPRGLPDPADPGYVAAVLAIAAPLVAAADGGAFLLFTSHRSLAAAAQLLRGAGGSRELLVQGEAPREQLLRQFRTSGRAVLLGTASFWEGVDVQGEALRLVVIDKVPFAPVDDPLVRARVGHITAQGGNAFREYQLPAAAMTLKQGVGRLIRSEHDRGVVAICDPRLHTRSYGRALIRALPPMTVSLELEPALRLLRDCAASMSSGKLEESRRA